MNVVYVVVYRGDGCDPACDMISVRGHLSDAIEDAASRCGSSGAWIEWIDDLGCDERVDARDRTALNVSEGLLQRGRCLSVVSQLGGLAYFSIYKMEVT